MLIRAKHLQTFSISAQSSRNVLSPATPASDQEWSQLLLSITVYITREDFKNN